MSRLNLNSILSWVDSHFIEYPTARKILLYFLFSIVHLVIISPFHGILCLILNTVYLFFHENYKNAFIIWVGFFFIWYLVFTVCLIGYDGPILITPDFFSDGDSEGRHVFFFIIDKYSSSRFPQSLFNVILESFCKDTLVLLLILSYIFNITIYLPSLLEMILIFFSVLLFVWRILKSIFGR